MECLSNEQLAALALGLDDADVLPHVSKCSACSTALAEMRQLSKLLAAAHSNSDHATSRARLLASLADVQIPAASAGTWQSAVSWLTRLTARQRLAAGGFGLTTAVVLLLLFLAFANSAGRLSAMERMVKQLREVASFSYDLKDVTIREGGEHPGKLVQSDKVYWRAPTSLRGAMHIEKWPEVNPSPDSKSEVRTDLVEIYAPGERGILIDYKTKTYFRTPELTSEDLGWNGPVNWLRRIQQGNVDVIRDLGIQARDGRQAHGYVVSLGNSRKTSGQNAVEVWVDPETDFPLTYSFKESGDEGTSEAWSDEFTVTNCRWNIELDSKLFDTTPPAGFEDVTPPTDEKTINAIVSALRLYAELSGGHYPNIVPFAADAVRDDMLKLAGFAGPPQPDWSSNKQYVQIQQASAGLQEIERVLHNHVTRAGYQGTTIGPQDKDKVLLWWMAERPEKFRVFFGDLRTEIVPLKEWQKIAPADIADVFRDEE